MRQSNRIERILGEQWGHPHTGGGRNLATTPCDVIEPWQPPRSLLPRGLRSRNTKAKKSMTGLTLNFIRSAWKHFSKAIARQDGADRGACRTV